MTCDVGRTGLQPSEYVRQNWLAMHGLAKWLQHAELQNEGGRLVQACKSGVSSSVVYPKSRLLHSR